MSRDIIILYPPFPRKSYFETRATVVELRPVSFSISLYGMYFHSIRAAFHLFANSSSSFSVNKSRKKTPCFVNSLKAEDYFH